MTRAEDMSQEAKAFQASFGDLLNILIARFKSLSQGISQNLNEENPIATSLFIDHRNNPYKISMIIILAFEIMEMWCFARIVLQGSIV